MPSWPWSNWPPGSVFAAPIRGASVPSVSAELAQAQLLSLAYLEQLFGHLRRAGLGCLGPRPRRRLPAGPAGRRISPSPRSSMRWMSRSAPPAARRARPAASAGERCLTHDLWSELGEQIRLFLAHVTLADVVEGRIAGRAVMPRAEGPPSPARRNCGGGAGAPAQPVDLLYLDANATEPLRPEARAAVIAALEAGGNPSSVHAAGRAARRRLEAAREAVAGRFGVRAQDVVFTAGGTEANALAVQGLGRGRRVLVGATEHPAVLAAAPGAGVIPVLPDGTIDLDGAGGDAGRGRPALVCLMAANNETGVLHPLAAAAALCRAQGALLHVDAVQAAGRVALAAGRELPGRSPATSWAGRPGAGALLLRPGWRSPALIAGGGQERGRRGGTEPLPAIAGLAAAAAAAPTEGGARWPRCATGSRPASRRWRRGDHRRRRGAAAAEYQPASSCPACRPRRR